MAGVLSTNSDCYKKRKICDEKTREEFEKIICLTYQLVQSKFANEFKNLYERLIKNAQTEEVDWKKFGNLLSILNFTKFPKTVWDSFFKMYKNEKDTEKAKKIESILIKQKLNPLETSKEIALGILKICIAYQMQFFATCLDRKTGKANITSIEKMSSGLADIILEHFIKMESTTLTYKEVCNSIINYIYKKKTVLNAITDTAKNITNPSSRNDSNISINLRIKIKDSYAKESIVNPKEIFSKAIILDMRYLNGFGELKNLKDGTYLKSLGCEDGKLDKYGIRLSFSEDIEKTEQYDKVEEHKIHEQVDNFVYGSYAFIFTKLSTEDQEDLVNKMCNLQLDDESKTSEEVEIGEPTENVLDKVEELIEEIKAQNAARAQNEASSAYHGPKQEMINKGQNYEYFNVLNEQKNKNGGNQKMVNEGNTYKGTAGAPLFVKNSQIS